jgi:glutamine synthetase
MATEHPDVSGKKYVEMLYTDPVGRLHDIEVSPGRFYESFENGKVIDGSSVGLTPIESSDLVLKPIPRMGFVPPWNSSSYVHLCDIKEGDGVLRDFDLNDRYILQKVIGKAKESGYTAWTANEQEYFNVSTHPLLAVKEMVKVNEAARRKDLGEWERLTEDQAFYMCTSPIDAFKDLRMRIYENLPLVGAAGEYSHHEVGSGQNEITFRYKDPVGLADTTMLFKFMARNMASAEGKTITFMPKPVVGMNGSGTHYHVSLTGKDGSNLMWGDKHENMSETGLHFIGGILEHSKGLTLGVAPSENSRKRLVQHYEAPILSVWGKRNRSGLVRIPSYQTKGAARIEFREPDNTGNPYRTLAFILAAGLDGIEKCIDPGEPYEKNAYHHIDDLKDLLVPQTQREAIDEFKKDTLFRDVMGQKAFDSYVGLVEASLDSYNRSNPGDWDVGSVSEFEYRKYLMI